MLNVKYFLRKTSKRFFLSFLCYVELRSVGVSKILKMSADLDTIKEVTDKFAGKWKQVRSENLEAFYQEMGTLSV